MCSSLDIGKIKKYMAIANIYLFRSVFSRIQAFLGFTRRVCNQYLSEKLVLYLYK